MNIVLLDGATLGDSDLAEISALGKLDIYSVTLQKEVNERISNAEIIITNKVQITKEIIKANPQLKLICIAATGMNNVDLIAADEAGVLVKNVKAYSTESVSQSTFSILFQLIHQARHYDHFTSSGAWSESDIFTNNEKSFFELKGKKWGIIGYGAIGQRVGDIASAFGCELCYHSTSGKNTDQPIPSVDLDTLLTSCDIISIHAPLNEQTKNLIDSDALSKLKKGAVILNLGRGGIIDEDAMAIAIDKQGIFHGTDVLEIEPMVKNHPYLRIKNKDNLVITPHIAWASAEARVVLIETIAQNIRSFINN